jgi:leucyl-tRNA synthetase
MSKSRGNVISPDEVIQEWGADSLRLFEMFMGPLEQTKPWQTKGISGVNRFLKRLWRLLIDESTGALCLSNNPSPHETLHKLLHKTIQRVTEDYEALGFNTAIAALMEFVNEAYRKQVALTQGQAEALVLLLAPLAPHIAEELWLCLGHDKSLAFAPWPTFDPSLIQEDRVTLSVMVDGKARATLEVAKTATKEEVLEEARKIDVVQRYMRDKVCVKELFVPEKIVNFVLK